jgi:hypothetical protein
MHYEFRPRKPQANHRRAHYRRAAAGAWPAAPPPGRSPAAPCRHASRNCVTTVSIHARPNGQAPSRKATWPPLRACARPRAPDAAAARSVRSLQACWAAGRVRIYPHAPEAARAGAQQALARAAQNVKLAPNAGAHRRARHAFGNASTDRRPGCAARLAGARSGAPERRTRG